MKVKTLLITIEKNRLLENTINNYKTNRLLENTIKNYKTNIKPT